MSLKSSRAALFAAVFVTSCAGADKSAAPEDAVLADRQQVGKPDISAPQVAARGPIRKSPVSRRPLVKVRHLTGLLGAELAQLLGTPGFRRIDEPAALWQYRGRDCILDLFLYADGRDYRVAHFEFRQKGVTPHKLLDTGGAERCLANMMPAESRTGDKG